MHEVLIAVRTYVLVYTQIKGVCHRKWAWSQKFPDMDISYQHDSEESIVDLGKLITAGYTLIQYVAIIL